MHDVVADTALQCIVTRPTVQRIVTAGAVEAVVAQRADQMVIGLAGAGLLVIEDVECHGLAGRQRAAVAVRYRIAEMHDVGETDHRRDGKGAVVIVDDRAVIGDQAGHRQRIAIRIGITRQQLRRRHHIGVILRTVGQNRVRAGGDRNGVAGRIRPQVRELQIFDTEDGRGLTGGVQRHEIQTVAAVYDCVVGPGTRKNSCVDAVAALQSILARTAVQGIVAKSPHQAVVTVIAVQHIIAAFAVQSIVSAASMQCVVAPLPGNVVPPVVGCRISVNPIVTGVAERQVAARSGSKFVISIRPQPEIVVAENINIAFQDAVRLRCHCAVRKFQGFDTVQPDQSRWRPVAKIEDVEGAVRIIIKVEFVLHDHVVRTRAGKDSDVVAVASIQGVASTAAIQSVIAQRSIETVGPGRAGENVIECVDVDIRADGQHTATIVRKIIAQGHRADKSDLRSQGKRAVVVIDDCAVVCGQTRQDQRITVRVGIATQELSGRDGKGVILLCVQFRMRAGRNRRGIRRANQGKGYGLIDRAAAVADMDCKHLCSRFTWRQRVQDGLVDRIGPVDLTSGVLGVCVLQYGRKMPQRPCGRIDGNGMGVSIRIEKENLAVGGTVQRGKCGRGRRRVDLKRLEDYTATDVVGNIRDYVAGRGLENNRLAIR